jgi:integrase
MKLTPQAVRTLAVPAGKAEVIFFDDDVPGFGLRLRAQGSRSFVFQYKLGTKQRRMALGAATAISVAEVRKIAERLYARVKLGDDPASDKAEARAGAAKTFKAVAADFLHHQQPRFRSGYFADFERHLMQHAKPLHELQLAKIKRADIAAVLGSVAKNNGLVAHNRVRTGLATFFAWGMKQGIIEANPVIGTARHKEHSRERVLAPTELRAIWNALGEDRFASIIKLLVLTGQRAGEISGLRWSEICGDTIVLSGSRTKNSREHRVPLSPPALAIIEAQPRKSGGELIFSRYASGGPFSAWSLCKRALAARITSATGKPLPHWTPHDLRRTAATGMADLGVQPHVIEAALNHVSGTIRGVAAIYNRSSYDREKRQALNLWAEHLLALVEDRQAIVMPLRREA